MTNANLPGHNCLLTLEAHAMKVDATESVYLNSLFSIPEIPRKATNNSDMPPLFNHPPTALPCLQHPPLLAAALHRLWLPQTQPRCAAAPPLAAGCLRQ